MLKTAAVGYDSHSLETNNAISLFKKRGEEEEANDTSCAFHLVIVTCDAIHRQQIHPTRITIARFSISFFLSLSFFFFFTNKPHNPLTISTAWLRCLVWYLLIVVVYYLPFRLWFQSNNWRHYAPSINRQQHTRRSNRAAIKAVN